MPYSPDIKKKYQPPKVVRPEHSEFLLRVGTKLKDLREQKNLSISQLASTLDISRNAYAQMEKGRVYSNMKSLLQVLDYHGIPASKFFKYL